VTLQYGTALESLANDTKAVIVEFAVNDTEWRVELPVEPVISNGVRAKRIDIVDSQRGIAFAARAIARAADFTAIEFEAFLDPPDVRPERRRRRIRGLGQSAGPGRLCGDQIVLRTETDELFVERGHPLLAEGAGRHREAVLFPPLPETLRTVTAELEHVWIDEPTDEIVRVPLPGEADIAIADCRAHVVTKRVPGADTAGSARVEVTPLDDVDAARRLAFISGVNVPDSSRYGMRIEHAVGKSPVVEVPEPSGTATEVTLQYPVIQIRGPWRLAISLPSVGAL
jgi:hypothetical protein